jgi:hypothetical protein
MQNSPINRLKPNFESDMNRNVYNTEINYGGA